MSQLLLKTSQCIFLAGHGDSRDSSTSFTALLASNLLAQFSRQIVIQILGLESLKVCGNLAIRPHNGDTDGVCLCIINIYVLITNIGYRNV
jgi:hypothetical protein